MPSKFWTALSLMMSTAALLTPAICAGEPRTLTESEFLSAAGGHLPAEAALSEILAEPEGRLRDAGLWSNPALWFEREALTDDEGQSAIGLNWEVPLLDGRRSLRKRAALAQREAARSSLALEKLGLRRRQRENFAGWIAAQARADATGRVSRSAQTLADYAARRAAAGEEPRLVAQRLFMAASETAAEHAHAQAALETARSAALAWLPEVDTATRPIWPDLPPVPENPNLENHPSVAGARHLLSSAQYESRLGRRWLQSPSLDAGWLRQNGSDGLDGPVFGFTFALPFFDRQQGDRASSRIAAAARSARLTLERVRTEAEWRGTAAAYEGLRAEVLSQPEPEPLIDSVLRAAEASFRAGETTATDYLETLRSVQSFWISAIELRAAAQEAHRRLEQAAGRPLTGY